MPGPLVPKRTAVWSQLFGWTEPENASVFDSTAEKVARRIINFLGLSDPNQIMMLATPMEVPNSDELGGVVGMLARKYPRFAKAIQAYHGSPHDFEQFSGEKIGTGEGAQAYGHGLYFAESPGVAQSYRDTLAYVNDQESRQILDTLPKTFQGPDNVRGIIANIRKAVAAGDITKPSQFAEQYDVGPHLQQAYKTAGAILDTKGRMYEVAIHADPSHFLDWDTPLSQQSEAVKAVFEEERQAGGFLGQFAPKATAFGELPGPDYTGADVVRATERQLGQGRGELVADRLKRLGIPGIKYLDAGSRAAGEGSRNYVVFPGNEHLIDILKKYGILATVGGGGLAASQSSQTPQ